MLLARVMFGEECSNWTRNEHYNYSFLRAQEDYINDIVRHRGYMYLNQIFEILGIEWHPDYENPCVRTDGSDHISFVQFEVFKQPNNEILVNIYSYN